MKRWILGSPECLGLKHENCALSGSQASSYDILMGYKLDGKGISSIPSRRKRFFSSPQHPDQLWGPSSLSSGYWGLLL
jgi:hypothetical protein